MAQWITKCTVNEHIKGKYMASSHLHNRLNVLTVQPLQGAPQLLQLMRLDDKGIRQNRQGTISSRSSTNKWQLQGTVVNLQPPHQFVQLAAATGHLYLLHPLKVQLAHLS